MTTQEIRSFTPPESAVPHQGQSLPTASAAHHQDLGLVLDWLLADADFSALRLRASRAWGAVGLARLALL